MITPNVRGMYMPSTSALRRWFLVVYIYLIFYSNYIKLILEHGPQTNLILEHAKPRKKKLIQITENKLLVTKCQQMKCLTHNTSIPASKQ